MSAETPATLTIFVATNGFVMGTLDVTYLGDEQVSVLVTESNVELLKIAKAGTGAEVRQGSEVLCSGLIVMTEYEYQTGLLTIRLRSVRPIDADPQRRLSDAEIGRVAWEAVHDHGAFRRDFPDEEYYEAVGAAVRAGGVR